MNCEECPLNGRDKVQGEGCWGNEHEPLDPSQYDIVEVGMAPAKEEDRRGLWSKFLEFTGTDEYRIYFAHIVFFNSILFLGDDPVAGSYKEKKSKGD